MSNGRCADATLPAPCAAVEDAGDGRKQHVAPVECGGLLVEMRKAKEAGREKQRAVAPHAPFKQVLQPAAKKQFLRHGDKEESEDPRKRGAAGRGPAWMQMQKAETEAEGQRNRGIEGGFAQANAKVFEAQAEIEAGSRKLADEDEPVDARIEKNNFVEDGKMWRPRSLKPAQIDGKAQGAEDEKVAPVAALIGIG